MTSRQVSLAVLLLVFSAGTVVGPVLGQTTIDSHGAQIELVGPSTVTPGETVTVEVNVTADRSIYAAQFSLSFDGTVLEADSVDQGDFLSRDAQSLLIVDEVGDGNVSYGETRVGTDTGIDGTGTLARISFTVAEDAPNGEFSLELYGVKLATPTAEPVDTSTHNLTVTVGESEEDGGQTGGGGGGGQAAAGPGGEVELADVSFLNDAATTGATVVTRVNLSNFDPVSGDIALTLTANGSVVAERTVSVAASTDRTVYLRHRFDQPGRYVLRVNGASAGTITVVPEETPTAVTTTGTVPTRTPTSSPGPTETETRSGTTAPSASPTVSPATTAGDGSGFGVLTVVMALGALVLLRATD